MSASDRVTGPTVSIIVPCHNAERTIARCLESCRRQTYPNFEIIVVDNKCTDGTMEQVREFVSRSNHPVQMIECSPLGPSNARNRGTEMARGEYIQLLDADDELLPEKLQRQVAALESAPDFSIAYGDWYQCFYLGLDDLEQRYDELRRTPTGVAYGHRDWDLKRESEYALAVQRFILEQYEDFLLRLLQDKWLPLHAYLYRREVAFSLGKHHLWDPGSKIATDRQYFTTAALLGHRFLYVPRAGVVYYLWSEGQMVARTPHRERAANLKRIFARLKELAGDRADLTREHRALLSNNWDLWSYRAVDREVKIPNSVPRGVVEKITGVLSRYEQSATLERLAKLIAFEVPTLWERHHEILQILEGFRESGHLYREQVV